MNSSYQTSRRAGGNGLQADLHEFQIAPGRRRLCHRLQPDPLRPSRSRASSDGAIIDTAIQEIDIKTGLVRWEWHSLDHVAAAESEVEAPKRDAVGLLPPQLDRPRAGRGPPDLGAQHLGGLPACRRQRRDPLAPRRQLKSSFEMGPGTKTAWQHDARMLPDGEITLFDDGSNPPVHTQSRGVRIALDRGAHGALVGPPTRTPTRRCSPPARATCRRCRDGNVRRRVRRRARDQRVRRRLAAVRRPPALRHVLLPRLPLPLERAAGEPAGGRGQPEQHRRRDDRAHELERRHRSRLLARARRHERGLAGARATIAASGFESSTMLPQKYSYAAVQALDRRGRVLGSSRPRRMISYDASLAARRRGERRELSSAAQ